MDSRILICFCVVICVFDLIRIRSILSGKKKVLGRFKGDFALLPSDKIPKQKGTAVIRLKQTRGTKIL
ncbi:hypothetical protein BWD12_10280 [Leptospira santarosai serovar Bananal]|nr:hypothetical protein BWD11_12810 [Leptospira santarosai serovar Grippotyphosa]ONF79092.1 hypothetical protein BWD12_10280 [Leptospira santarosai serovar Bananal]